jgi:integrative and conjugative element protein (TIGR02256 family)
VCGVGSPESLLLSDELRAEMTRQARNHAPNETGGILVGRRTGSVIEVLAVSDAGLKAISKPMRFERDGEYCQAYLERVAHELGPGVDYVGEWHSHPGSSAAPSSRDTMSFEEIAEDPDYLTRVPLLVIVAPSRDSDRVDWSFTLFPAGGLARTVELNGVESEEPGRHSESIATDVAVPSAATT